MASRYATRPGRPSVNSSSRHSASRNPGGDTTTTSNAEFQRRFRDAPTADDEESSASIFPMWKTIAVVAVVVGCFAAVYPKMFHPMLLYALGYGQNSKAEDSEVFPHPAMKHGSGHGPPRQANFPGGAQSGRQPGAYPGARGGPMPGMGAGINPMGEGGKGTKSMWHWMLPFYTIGVIVFLLYTLSKILWKKPAPNTTRRRLRYNAERDRVEADDPEFDDEELEEEELEDEDGRNGSVMNNKQLRGLQRRLQDTELTMHEILTQLEQLSTTADPNAAEEIKKMTLETLSNLGKLSADRASSRNSDSTNYGINGGQGGSLRFDANEKRYLNDLQKALADFKQFTENYIEEHSTKQQQENQKDDDDGVASETTNVEEKEKAEMGQASGSKGNNEFDVMESEKTCSIDELKVEIGEGELIPLLDGKEGDFGSIEKRVTSGQGGSGQAKKEEEYKDEELGEQEKKSKKHNVRQRKGKKHVRHEE